LQIEDCVGDLGRLGEFGGFVFWRLLRGQGSVETAKESSQDQDLQPHFRALSSGMGPLPLESGLAARLARGQSPFDGVKQRVIGKRLLQHGDSPGPLQPFCGAGIIQRGNQDHRKAGRGAGEMVLEVGAAHSRKTNICYEAIGVAGIVGEELFGGLKGKNGEAGRSQKPAERTPNFFVVVYYCYQGVRPRAPSAAIHGLTNYSPTRMSAIGPLGSPPASL